MVTHERQEPSVDVSVTLDAMWHRRDDPHYRQCIRMERCRTCSRCQSRAHRALEDDRLLPAAIVDVNGLACGMDLEAARPQSRTRTFWKHQLPVLGVAGGQPACSAAVLMVDGHRYIALVAT